MKITNYAFLFLACVVLTFFSLMAGYFIGRYSWDCKDCPKTTTDWFCPEPKPDNELIDKLNLCEQAVGLMRQVEDAKLKLKGL